MIIGDTALGVIATYHPTQNHVYSEIDLEFLQAMANLVAIALRNIHLYHDIYHRQNILIDLARKLTSKTEIEEKEILDFIRENASELMDMDNMYIALYDKDTDFVRFPLLYKNGYRIEVKSRRAGAGRTEEIIRTKQPIFIATKAESEKWYAQPGRAEYIQDPLASWMGVPMRVGDDILGVIATYHPEKEYVYRRDDLAILQAMANISTIALVVLENKKLIEELKRVQIEVADRERDLVTSGLAMDFAHKMNNIAGTIPPWVTLIQRKLRDIPECDSKIYDYLGNIQEEVTALLKEAYALRQSTTTAEPIDMQELIGSLVGQWEMIASPDIVIRFQEAPHPLLPVYGIKPQLSVAIDSIVRNAVKSISGKGEITLIVNGKIFSEKDKQSITVTISDTGCGIPVEHQELIFEYGTTYWPDKTGTGYGLWRARNIIQSMGGILTLTHSFIGQGTTFTLVLPSVKPEGRLMHTSNEEEIYEKSKETTQNDSGD